ncbi:MAG: MarR family transcriptional regulator [Desulfobacterales bacterium]
MLDISRKEVDQLLFNTMTAIYKFERRKVQLFGINYEAFYLLYFLRRRSSARMREIAEELGIHISTASRAVGRLEKRNLVSRKKDPEDRRSILVSLELEGERIVRASEDHSYTTIKKNIEGLNDNTVKAIVTTASCFDQILSTPSIMAGSDESAQDQ